jgi:hypothetical protein
LLTYIALKCQIKITVKDQIVTPSTPKIDIMRVQARIVVGMPFGKGKEMDFFLISVLQVACINGWVKIFH